MKVAISDYVTSPAEIERKVFCEEEFLFLEGKNLENEDLSGVEVLLAWHEKINESYLSHFPDLKVVVRYGVGFDSIDLEAIEKRNLVFANTPDYGTEEVADTACAMILNASRKISYYDSACRNYQGTTWQENFDKTIKRSNQTTVGIIGAGRIGSAVVARLKSFGFNILGLDPYQPSGHEKSIGYSRVDDLEQLLSSSDIVSIHCPCNEETMGIINDEFLSKMKPGAALVNTARGKLLSSLDDLEKHLCSGHLSSVQLDVIPEEPIDKSHSLVKKWLERDPSIEGKLVINPHTAFYSESAWYEMRYKCAETAKIFLETGKLRNQIKA
jgi:D-3-phosphoglycerate dehydrogenase